MDTDRETVCFILNCAHQSDPGRIRTEFVEWVNRRLEKTSSRVRLEPAPSNCEPIELHGLGTVFLCGDTSDTRPETVSFVKDAADLLSLVMERPHAGPGAVDSSDAEARDLELARLNRQLRMLSCANQAIIRAASEPKLLDEICRVVVETGGHHVAFVGLAQDDPEKTIKVVAGAGMPFERLQGLKISWGDGAYGQGASGTAVRTGRTFVSLDVQSNPVNAPWKDVSHQYNLRAVVAAPLKSNGRTYGVLSVYSRTPGSFLYKEIELLEELAEDVAYGLEAIRTRARHAETLEALRDSERRLQEIIAGSPFGAHTYKLLPNGRLIFTGYNPAADRILRMDHAPLVGMTVEEAFPGLIGTDIPDIYRGVAAHGGTYEKEQVAYDQDSISGVFEVFGFQTALNRMAVFFRDVTDKKKAEENKRQFERHLEEQKRQFYRNTILSVTDGKLDVCEASDVRPYLSGAGMLTDVDGPSNVSVARKLAQQRLIELGLTGEELGVFIAGVGEALANAVKHARRGRVYVGGNQERVWAAIRDTGPGIDSLILPRATLWRGFSTKPSLGLGYSIMLEVCDQIMLKTGVRGTTVVLIKRLKPAEGWALDSMPDTWANAI